MTPLSKMMPGQKGVIVGFTDDNKISRRLLELGVVPGKSVFYVRNAPLRDPMQIQVGASCVTLRHNEASLIKVKIDE